VGRAGRVPGMRAARPVNAIVIRCLLVPAMVTLFGRFNWWLPAPLARLLRVPAGPAGPAPVAAPEEEAVREMDTVAMLSR
jgi:RND superfamily putative drug exporter